MQVVVNRVGRIFAARWNDVEVTDLPEVATLVRQAHAEVGKLLYIAAIAPYSRVPNRAERRALNDYAAGIKQLLEAVYLVFEGDGLRHKLQRTATTGILLFALQSKLPTTVHKTIAEVVPDLAARLGQSQETVRASLGARGLI
jgi:hypothetical protein